VVENQSGHVVRSWTPLTLCCTHCAPQAFHHCVRDHCHPEHWDRGGIPRESEKENMQQETDEQTVLTVHMTHLVNNRQKQNKNKVIGCWVSHGGRGDRLHGPPGRELSPRTSAESSVDAKSKVRACMNISIWSMTCWMVSRWLRSSSQITQIANQNVGYKVAAFFLLCRDLRIPKKRFSTGQGSTLVIHCLFEGPCFRGDCFSSKKIVRLHLKSVLHLLSFCTLSSLCSRCVARDSLMIGV